MIRDYLEATIIMIIMAKKQAIVIRDCLVVITIMTLITKVLAPAIQECLVGIVTIHQVDAMSPRVFMEVMIVPRCGC